MRDRTRARTRGDDDEGDAGRRRLLATAQLRIERVETMKEKECLLLLGRTHRVRACVRCCCTLLLLFRGGATMLRILPER